jgi:hypothetical protein
MDVNEMISELPRSSNQHGREGTAISCVIAFAVEMEVVPARYRFIEVMALDVSGCLVDRSTRLWHYRPEPRLHIIIQRLATFARQQTGQRMREF